VPVEGALYDAPLPLSPMSSAYSYRPEPLHSVNSLLPRTELDFL
jgi:hypothetical protein